MVWHSRLVEKLHTKSIHSNLLELLEDYLRGKTLQVVINGQSSRPSPIQASVPQGSVLGPNLWNICIDDLPRQLSIEAAYADDCTLSHSYCRLDSQRAVSELNRQTGRGVEKSVAGQLCSGEDAGDGHLTVPRCFSSCLRTGVFRGKVSRSTSRPWEWLWTVACVSTTRLPPPPDRLCSVSLSSVGWQATSTPMASSPCTRHRYGRVWSTVL